MSLDTESVSRPGSGLVFVNYYGDGVTDAYRSAIISAENFLESHFTNAVTVGVSFDLKSLGATFSAQNEFDSVPVSYATLSAALRAHATTADDILAVNGLPAADPSHGAGFSIPTTQARILGLAPQSNTIDDSVVLNSDLNFTFGQDAIGALEHEITEGVFGRTSSLGFDGARFEALDLFRFTAGGVRDFTGGSDGAATFFGIDSQHVTNLAFHNSISATGMNDGFDLGDWDNTRGDAFGPGGPGSPGTVSTTDLRVLDVLGWNPTGSGVGFQPAPDEFASSLTDASHPFGQLAVGGSAAGALQTAGDRDWFAVQFQAGDTYTVNLVGRAGGGGTLADPFLRLHDAGGTLLASNDDVTDGSDPDSRLVFTAPSSGTFYVEAGSFVDGYTGTYRVDVSQTGTGATAAGEVLVGAAGGDTLQGGAGGDTITGGASGVNYLRGNDGDDVITGGSAFDDINGNMGNDTLHGGAGDDWVVGGKGNDVQFGDAGNDVVWGNLGNDTLDGGDGADQVRGGQGDDVLSGGAGDDFISGDRGNDTESGGAGADLFHTSQDAGIDKVLDFNLAEGDRVMLDPGTTFTVSQVGADTVIDFGAGNEMILVGVQMSTLTGNWIFGN
ncbi:NF038122 family metalloprotease [Phenylobacterium sp.]|uniref:NF038122 family metalloprotease n=1 Tax=Phenylobacterium sp. TaxID=1871053 RepID=UPI003566F74C